MLNIKIAYNNKSDQRFKQLAVNPFFELFNEDEPKEIKGAWKYKGEAGARQVPFIGIYENGKLIKALYSEDKSATFDNLIEYVQNYIDEHAKPGFITLTKIEGTEPLGEKHSGYTKGLCEGIGCRLESPDGFWFHTSIIKEIDWENQIFTTLNSKYKFEFDD